jgi:hypothetical protein
VRISEAHTIREILEPQQVDPASFYRLSSNDFPAFEGRCQITNSVQVRRSAFFGPMPIRKYTSDKHFRIVSKTSQRATDNHFPPQKQRLYNHYDFGKRVAE